MDAGIRNENEDINISDSHLDYDVEDIAFNMKKTNVLLRRWIAYFIDLFVLLCLLIVFQLTFGEETYITLIPFIIILQLSYHPILEATSGYTIGKYFLGIRVLTQKGESPGFLKSIIRQLLRLVELNPLLIGGIPALISVILSNTSQRIGDRLANTYVVPVNKLDLLK